MDVEAVHPLERAFVMDGVQDYQSPFKRLKALLSVPKWQKQMIQVEARPHYYAFPDTDASRVL